MDNFKELTVDNFSKPDEMALVLFYEDGEQKRGLAQYRSHHQGAVIYELRAYVGFCIVTCSKEIYPTHYFELPDVHQVSDNPT